jgi:hypothetical protein
MFQCVAHVHGPYIGVRDGKRRAFCVEIKDAGFIIPISEWHTLGIGRTVDYSFCYWGAGVLEHCEDSYVSFLAWIPILAVGESRIVRILEVKRTMSKLPLWNDCWRYTFGCEPPKDGGLTYEILTE